MLVVLSSKEKAARAHVLVPLRVIFGVENTSCSTFKMEGKREKAGRFAAGRMLPKQCQEQE